MSRIRWFSGLTCAALLASGPALAAERRWEVMETPHFSLHYYPETKESAQAVATAAEEVLPKLLKDFGIELQNRVPIILSREVMFNGNAEPIKDRITLDPLLAKSSVIGTKRFIAHELTHVITFQALASNALFSKLTKLSSLSNLPTWFLEGLAQYEAEAWSPNNDRMLRLGALEGKLLTEGQRNHFAMLGLYGGAAGYNEGYSLTKYLFDTYGHDKLNKLFTALRTDATLTFPIALEKVTGKKLGVIQEEWQKSIKQRYETLAKNTSALPNGAVSLVPSKDGTANVAPRLSPDGKQLAYLTSDGQESYLYLRGHIMGLLSLAIADPDGKNARVLPVFPGRIDGFSWGNNQELVLTAIASDEEGNPEYRLLRYSIPKKKASTLAKAPFLGSPAWRPGSDQVAFVGEKDAQSTLELLDVKTGKRITTALDAKRYENLNWSPDGRKLVASAYLPGDGGKIVLIDPLTGKTKALTKGPAEVGDTHPVWSPNGEEVVFASDRDSLGNLYRLDVATGKVERITKAYRGLEHPQFMGQDLLFVSHHALGSEIHRFRPGAGEAVAPAKNQKLEKAERGEKALPQNWSLHPYSPKLTNDLFIPQFASDERGQQIGLMTIYSDTLNQHQLGLDVRLGLASQRFSYTASYLNRMGTDPWMIALYDRPELVISDKIDPNRFYDTLYLGRNQGVSAALQHSLGGGQSLQAGASMGYLSTLLLPENMTNKPRVGRQNTLSLQWSDTRLKGGMDADVTPRDGYQVGLGYLFSDRKLGSDFNFSQWSLSGDRFIPVGSSVLGWHFKGAVQSGDNTPLYLGGVQGFSPLFPLRGYLAGSFAGNRLAYAGMDYTTPLMGNLDKQLGAFYLNKLFATGFIESGDAWTGGGAFTPHPTAGAELRLKTAFMGRQVVIFRLGVAHQLTGDRDTRFYLVF